MSNPKNPMTSALWQLIKHGHVYASTTSQYSPWDNNPNGDGRNRFPQARNDGTSASQPAMNLKKKLRRTGRSPR